MAASLTSQVNQRLACARMLHTDLASARSPVHKRALLDACLFHLLCGYQFYIKELASYYGVKYVQGLKSETDAAQALSQLDKHPAEIQELCNLAELPNSWLSQLRGLYDDVWAMPGKVSAIDANAIAVTNLDAQRLPELDDELIAQFCHQFQELVNRHRETSVEC
ncbi:hypothetical protein KO507_05050 [Gilvimarinus agarilyticus]|uniref:DUF6586 family protein n=1 Tax=Gilvimarinus sp. 2_MG-2023 TaxID=3062666 RepID=UPI001C089468|nr:DUF6586 family protein [Gilvimarinus sp. 2_MG-2023]MBU2885129.1 hypothetical protein [Gilvimarinus agarilyticus]MDO6570027.1 hypothetical protein [Gilvimarinus sp. 2_MG-2023]